MKLTIDDVVARMDDFPTLPTIYTQLMELMANSRSTVQDLAEVIMKDQSSTTKILKVVNSPVYALKQRVTNISQAIFYLGFKEVKNIVLALSVLDVFSKISANIDFDIQDLWKHSIAVGVISKVLGMYYGERNTEDYFVCGIIHDIGILFFLKYFSKTFQKVVLKTIELNVPLAEVERRVFGLSHHHVGDMIAKKWNLPILLRKTIRYQHIGSVNTKVESLVASVHLANIIANMMNIGYMHDSYIPKPNFEIWNHLSEQETAITDLYQPIHDTYNQFISILKMK